jgi:tetratricopeptide (TPR) repeat protein
MDAEEAYHGHQTQRFETLCRELGHSSRPELRLEAALLEARFWFDMSEYGRAIAVLTDASTLVPEDPRPWSGLSRLALVSGNSDRAMRLADKAVKIDSSDLSSVCSSALAYFEADPLRSFESWTIANALAPDEHCIAKFLCSLALSQGRHEEGLMLLDRVGMYQLNASPLNDHVGLLALTNAALK